MDPSMLWPLIVMTLATKAWFVGSLLQRARAANLENEAGKDWVRATVGGVS
jgi:heme exporter protein C